MPPVAAPRAQRIGVALVRLALAPLVIGAVAVAGLGFRTEVFGVRLSLHDPVRPLILAAILGAIGARLAGTGRAAAIFEPWHRRLTRHAAALACSLALVIGLVTLYGGAWVAGGADSSGYVSQSRLWREGSMTIRTPLASELMLTNGQFAFTPVGYRPSGTPGEAIPAYPPGLPLLMALSRVAGGSTAPFVVVPICLAGLVIVTFLLAHRMAGAEAGLLAAAAAACAPIVLYQGLQPMSDVPAAFFWTLAVWLLTYEPLTVVLLAGVAAAGAFLIRPNLIAVAPVLAIGAWCWSRQTAQQRSARTVVFAIPLAIAAALFALLQRRWFGAVTATGYGDVFTLFSLDHVAANLQRYPYWLVSTHWPLVLPALAGPIAIRRGWVEPAIDRAGAERMAWTGVACFCALTAFYLLYLVFDDWVYVRFLLPALPWLFALSGAAMASLCRLAPVPLRGAALLLAALLAAGWGLDRARTRGAFHLADTERRYVDVAAFASTLPAGTAFIGLQHSGSLSYYAKAPVLRWDWIEPHEIDPAVSQLAARGRATYAVLDDWEEAQFRARFPTTRTVERLQRPVFTAGSKGGIVTQVYAVTGTTTSAAAAPFSWRSLPAPRTPSRLATPDRAPSLASSRR